MLQAQLKKHFQEKFLKSIFLKKTVNKKYCALQDTMSKGIEFDTKHEKMGKKIKPTKSD